MYSMVFRKAFCRLVSVTMMLGSLNACLLGPDFNPPAAPKVDHYTTPPWSHKTVSALGKAGAPQSFIKAKCVPTQWWRLFRSPKLNQLICRGLANSPNLSVAKAVLREAQENLSAGIGNGLFPVLSLQASGQRGSGNGFGSNTSGSTTTGSLPFSDSIFNLFNASVNVTYIFDIFGGVRRQIQALQSQVNYQYFELQAAYLSLTANIATSVITIASLQKQIRVTKQLICEQQEQLVIIKKQFELGGVAQGDVLAQQTQLAQTRASLPPLEKSWAQTRHVLAILVGSFPSKSHIPSLDLDEFHLPANLPLSLPSVLVRHRPDIRAAEALWEAANAQIGVATANLFPQFTISGNYGRSSLVGSKLFSAQNSLWNLGGSLLQPLFKGGALLATRRATLAAYDQAAAQYRQVVLQAFQNVADVLRALETDARETRAQKQAELAARANLQLARQQFSLGGVSYLFLLDAQRQYQQTRINLIQAQASRYTDTAALFQALGGGW